VNAVEQREIAKRLDKALTDAGISVQRMDIVAGNLRAWEDVSAEGIIGRWLQQGWKVTYE